MTNQSVQESSKLELSSRFLSTSKFCAPSCFLQAFFCASDCNQNDTILVRDDRIVDFTALRLFCILETNFSNFSLRKHYGLLCVFLFFLLFANLSNGGLAPFPARHPLPDSSFSPFLFFCIAETNFSHLLFEKHCVLFIVFDFRIFPMVALPRFQAGAPSPIQRLGFFFT